MDAAALGLKRMQLYLQFERALSEFLAARLSDDDMSYPDAERVTRLIGAENARLAYRLDGLALPALRARRRWPRWRRTPHGSPRPGCRPARSP